ncbi:MAG: hypothetical protein K2F79_07845, partial [Muribaculaceae bacterium]|nr:hypothetical protein [Muribaculaceae bacterium]
QKKKKDNEDEAPGFTVDSITGDTTFLPPPDMEWLTLSAGSGAQDLHKPLIISAAVPLDTIDEAGVHLEEMTDTVWIPRPATLLPDSADRHRRRILAQNWTPGAKYRLSIDSLAARSIYGTWNRPFRLEFSTKNTEDYSNLNFTLPGTDSLQVVVQLLNSADKPVYQIVKEPGTDRAEFRYLSPGTYFARLFIDSTPNGKWDTGSPLDHIQPEEVYYFAKKLTLKKNWDVEQTWDIDELPVDQQKPYAIKTNKPKLKRGEKAPGQEEDEEQDDGYGYGPQNTPGHGSNGGFGGLGGFGSGSRRPAGNSANTNAR